MALDLQSRAAQYGTCGLSSTSELNQKWGNTESIAESDMHTWSEPQELQNYKNAVRGPGLYVIGKPKDGRPSGSGKKSAYLLNNWPDNFVPEYVGISESMGSGVRGRLSEHARSKGSKHVKKLLAAGESLYFITINGKDTSEYEAAFLILKTKCQFAGNVRCEINRSAKRRYDAVRAEMSDWEKEYFDHLEIEGDGM
jgi:hypothetical protein